MICQDLTPISLCDPYFFVTPISLKNDDWMADLRCLTLSEI